METGIDLFPSDARLRLAPQTHPRRRSRTALAHHCVVRARSSCFATAPGPRRTAPPAGVGLGHKKATISSQRLRWGAGAGAELAGESTCLGRNRWPLTRSLLPRGGAPLLDLPRSKRSVVQIPKPSRAV